MNVHKIPRDYAPKKDDKFEILSRRERIVWNIMLVLSGACGASLFLAACYMVGGM